MEDEIFMTVEDNTVELIVLYKKIKNLSLNSHCIRCLFSNTKKKKIKRLSLH